MAHRIGDYILRGELRNTRANGVFGWLEFAPDYGVHIELTGNLGGDLQNKHIRFSTPRGSTPDSHAPLELPEEIESLADRQIGVVGDVVLRRVRVPTIPLLEFSKLPRSDQQRFSVEKDCLYLEWFSQNGRVVAEIIDPQIEFVDDRNNPDTEDHNSLESGPRNAGLPGDLHHNDDLHSHIAEAYLGLGPGSEGADNFVDSDDDIEEDLEDEADEDPYGLFDPDLQRDVSDALLAETSFDDDLLPDPLLDLEPPFADLPKQKRSWDEVIPGIDPETKAMYEQWDEIFEGEKDEPVAYLFETPLRLPPPDRVSSDEEARALVVSILAQLALLSVAVDVCEHFSPLQTYRLLMTEILPTAKVHPNLAASRMVQHYSTSDYCDACEAEFDAQYEADSFHPDDEN
jgi:hypothetical protein